VCEVPDRDERPHYVRFYPATEGNHPDWLSRVAKWYNQEGGKAYLLRDPRTVPDQTEIAAAWGVGNEYKALKKSSKWKGKSLSDQLYQFVLLCKRDGTSPCGEGGPWEGLHRFAAVMFTMFASDISATSSVIQPGSLTKKAQLTYNNDSYDDIDDVDLSNTLQNILKSKEDNTTMLNKPLRIRVYFPVKCLGSTAGDDLKRLRAKSESEMSQKRNAAVPSLCASLGGFLKDFHGLYKRFSGDPTTANSTPRYPDFSGEDYEFASKRPAFAKVKKGDFENEVTHNNEKQQCNLPSILFSESFEAYRKQPFGSKNGVSHLDSFLQDHQVPVLGPVGGDDDKIQGPFPLDFQSLVVHAGERSTKQLNALAFNDLILIPSIYHILFAATQNVHRGSQQVWENKVVEQHVRYLVNYHAGVVPPTINLHKCAEHLYDIYYTATTKTMYDQGLDILSATLAIVHMVNAMLLFSEEQDGFTISRAFRSIEVNDRSLSANDIIACFGKFQTNFCCFVSNGTPEQISHLNKPS
jgi:hypothetical protein